MNTGTRPYKQIVSFLMENIEQTGYTPNYRLPSERMLSIKFQASRRSIRLAYDKLIEQGYVTKVHGKGYFTTNNIGILLNEKPHSSKKIYFIVPALKTSFAQDILYGISDFCDKHYLDVSIKLSKSNLSKETQYINSAFYSDAKGIILFPTDNEAYNEALVKLSASRYPITIIDRYFENINSSFISTDNYNAIITAIEFLHNKKHKNILYLTSPEKLATTVKERLKGYVEGIKKYYGVETKRHILVVDNFSFEEIYSKVTDYLNRNPEIEVIMVVGWQVATDAVIAAVNSLNLSIPKDIKLMLFDCDFSSTEIKLLQPYVIQQDAYQIGYKAASTLYNQIYGDLRVETVRMPIKIIDYTIHQRKITTPADLTE